MSKQPVNQTFHKQQKTLVPATFKKGFVLAVNVAANTIDVAFAENPNTAVRNIPLARDVSITTISVGQKCRVDVFDETNPNDMVVAYSY